MQEQVRRGAVFSWRTLLRPVHLQASPPNQMTTRRNICGGWDESSLARLYGIFREKMHEVYRRNYMPNPFSDAMSVEFNAWQSYLRDSLSLDVRDADPSQKNEVLSENGSTCTVRVLNPSNGAAFGHEYIVISEDMARKILALGGLPDQL